MVEKLGISQHTAEMVMTEVAHELCREWRGDRPYIGAADAAARMSERNRAIIREFKAGESVLFLSRRYNLSRQRIWKIITG